MLLDLLPILEEETPVTPGVVRRAGRPASPPLARIGGTVRVTATATVTVSGQPRHTSNSVVSTLATLDVQGVRGCTCSTGATATINVTAGKAFHIEEEDELQLLGLL